VAAGSAASLPLDIQVEINRARTSSADPRIHFHHTPTSASWLNKIEGFFGHLGQALPVEVSDSASKRALRDHLVAYLRAWNPNPTPFEGPSRHAR